MPWVAATSFVGNPDEIAINSELLKLGFPE